MVQMYADVFYWICCIELQTVKECNPSSLKLRTGRRNKSIIAALQLSKKKLSNQSKQQGGDAVDDSYNKNTFSSKVIVYVYVKCEEGGVGEQR